MALRTHRRLTTVIALGAAASCVTGPALAGSAVAGPTSGTHAGPSSSDIPYLFPHTSGVSITSILTAGDRVKLTDGVNGYTMAGTPDGLGAFDNHDGTFTVLMNHEFGSTVSVPRSHGNTAGSFVSRYIVDKKTLLVISGSDQIQDFVTDGSKDLDRLCSADLPALTAFYNPRTRKGYDGRIFTNGEESAPNGRALANVVSTHTTYELSALGRAGWENVVANPGTGDRTVVMGQSDGGSQNVYVYAGDKQRSGSEIERAGLTNGTSSSILVPSLPTEDGAVAVGDRPMPFELGAAGAGTVWDRPEDGAWDPRDPDVYYFATTASMTKHSRLWKVEFKDAKRPELGGTITKLLEGPADDSPSSTGPKMMDNITVNDRHQVLIQEDPGGNPYLAGIYRFDTKSAELERIADHDPERFTPDGAYFDTIDEESSGIIWTPFLGRDTYLLDDQNHTKVADQAVYEKGQLLALSLKSGRGGHDGHGNGDHGHRIH